MPVGNLFYERIRHPPGSHPQFGPQFANAHPTETPRQLSRPRGVGLIDAPYPRCSAVLDSAPLRPPCQPESPPSVSPGQLPGTLRLRFGSLAPPNPVVLI